MNKYPDKLIENLQVTFNSFNKKITYVIRYMERNKLIIQGVSKLKESLREHFLSIQKIIEWQNTRDKYFTIDKHFFNVFEESALEDQGLMIEEDQKSHDIPLTTNTKDPELYKNFFENQKIENFRNYLNLGTLKLSRIEEPEKVSNGNYILESESTQRKVKKLKSQLEVQLKESVRNYKIIKTNLHKRNFKKRNERRTSFQIIRLEKKNWKIKVIYLNYLKRDKIIEKFNNSVYSQNLLTSILSNLEYQMLKRRNMELKHKIKLIPKNSMMGKIIKIKGPEALFGKGIYSDIKRIKNNESDNSEIRGDCSNFDINGDLNYEGEDSEEDEGCDPNFGIVKTYDEELYVFGFEEEFSTDE